ncbi:MAG: RNA recognition motif domain-containing protein [bacterium]
MSMKLYVGNLSYQVTEDELNEIFAAFGTVESVKIITDRETGQSRGFGFVEMSSKEEGEAAMNELNGKDAQGRSLVVNEARPRQERRSQGGGQRGGYRSSFGYSGGDRDRY